MDPNTWWRTFEKTGRVEDYLQYRSMLAQMGGSEPFGGEETEDAAEHRWDHHQGDGSSRG